VELLLTHGYFLAEDAQERKVMKPYPPLGLLYVSSHLKARGFEVALFDSTFASYAEFAAFVQRERPRIVGIYCNLMTKRNVVRMMAACRRAGAAVVLGGPEPPHDAEAYLDHGADVVVIGEGERTLEELIPLLTAGAASRDLSGVDGVVYRDQHGRVVRTHERALIVDLDAQPRPDRDSIDVNRYLEAWRSHHGTGSVSLTTARGCPYTCRWCSRSVFGETHRRRSPANVADEVQEIVERYRPDMLWYVDDVFTIHKGWILEYQAEISRRGLRIPFECISRAERIDEDVAKALAGLGCRRLWIGSESGSQRILDAMDRRITVAQVQSSTKLLQAHGIQVGMFIMLGYAGESEADLAATIAHLKASSPDVFLTTVAYPIKGTPYYEELKERLVARGAWADRTDRELIVAGRHSPLYYRFANQWMVGEVDRHRHWREGRYLRALRSAALAGSGRLGMALVRRQQAS
jgi:radical SAM superfamily enzyme YgiQ (UPF0313 family)